MRSQSTYTEADIVTVGYFWQMYCSHLMGQRNICCALTPLLEFLEKVQDSPIFILSSLIGLLWTLARDFFKTRTKNTLRLAGLKAKVHTFMLYGMW